METEGFRFESKVQYEQELARLLSEIGTRRQRKAKTSAYEATYETLLEEYMRFCSEDAGDAE